MTPSEEIALGPEEIAQCIIVLRGQRVLLDADLARIYGVLTKRLNEQVKRNLRRFPEDFLFQFTRAETQAITRLRSQNATLEKGRHIKHLPYAYQRRLACGAPTRPETAERDRAACSESACPELVERGTPCTSRLISIPTSLDKTT